MNTEISENPNKNNYRPTIQDLYNLAMNIDENPPIELSEDELKTNKSVKNKKCIFANESMMEKYEQLPEDVKERFKNYGNDYYSKVIDTIAGGVEDAAKKILVSVRSGISPSELDDNDLTIVRTIYGNEWYKLAGLDSEQSE